MLLNAVNIGSLLLGFDLWGGFSSAGALFLDIDDVDVSIGL